MAYVILSRVTAINQIFLEEFNPKKIYCSLDARGEVERLSTRSTKLQKTEWIIPKPRAIRITSINARSLQQHYQDLRKDAFLNKSDIICIQETWLEENLQDEDNTFNHYYVHGRTKGIALMTKTIPVSTHNFQSTHCSILKACYKDFDVINVYRFANDTKLKEFTVEVMEELDITRTQVVLGDFNINILKFPTNIFTSTLEEIGFQQLVVTSTHTLGGCLDHVYFLSPNNNVCCKLFLSYRVFWSDHCSQSIIMDFPDTIENTSQM